MNLEAKIEHAQQLVERALDEAADLILDELKHNPQLVQVLRVKLIEIYGVGDDYRIEDGEQRIRSPRKVPASSSTKGQFAKKSNLASSAPKPPPATGKRAAWLAWWDEQLTPIASLPDGSAERTKAIREWLAKTHATPDGKRQISGPPVYKHLARIAKARGRKTKPATTRAPASDDEDEPVTDKPRITMTGAIHAHDQARPESAREAERARMQADGLIGNPLYLAVGAEPERKTSCPAYNKCLSFILRHAPVRGVRDKNKVTHKLPVDTNWTCAGCVGPGIQLGNRTSDDDHLSTAAMLQAKRDFAELGGGA